MKHPPPNWELGKLMTPPPPKVPIFVYLFRSCVALCAGAKNMILRLCIKASIAPVL